MHTMQFARKNKSNNNPCTVGGTGVLRTKIWAQRHTCVTKAATVVNLN